MNYNTAMIPGSLDSKGPAAVAAVLRSLVEDNMTAEARQVYQNYEKTRPDEPDLRIFYIDILIKAGELGDAEKLLEAELKKQPGQFALLFRLGRIDEIRGSHLSALDLFRQAESRARIAADKKEAQAAVQRVSGKIKSDVTFKPDSFTINLEGNGTPLNLQYNLEQMLKRRELFEVLLTEIDPRAKTVLELECDTGLISRGLAHHGLKVEATASDMTDIVLAMGFDYVEMLRKTMPAGPDYNCFDLDPQAVHALEKYDVIALLPCRAGWYRERGFEKSLKLIHELAGKTKRQLFVYLPAPATGDVCETTLLGQLAERLNMGEGFPSTPERCYQWHDGASLYKVKQRQAGPGERAKLLPHSLAVLGSRSAVLEVEVAKCSSLNGFSYAAGGWHHFTAALKELLNDPNLEYKDSILKRFYERYRPRNRHEQFFGALDNSFPPLDRGWTLLPWVDTKNRSLNPGESPKLYTGGNPHYGPNSEDFGNQVLKRLLASYMLVSRYGYLPEIFPDGYIQGYLLKNGDDYRFYVNEGQHRMAAIGLLGFETIKVRFNLDFLPVVDLKNIKHWPQVRRGLYSEDIAEKVFRYYFEENGRRKAEQLGLLPCCLKTKS